jgi:uncharacterized protein YdaL
MIRKTVAQDKCRSRGSCNSAHQAGAIRAKRTLLLTLILFFSVTTGLWPGPQQPPVLIAYDSSGPYGWIGEIHARELGNLLGHFGLSYVRKPIEQYVAGELSNYRAAFYLGNVWNNTLPVSFIQNVLTTDKTVCWFKYNLWQLPSSQFDSRFGFHFYWMDPSGYPTIAYKGETFSKYQADPELGLTGVVNPALCSAVASAYATNGSSIPYILHGRNLWYIADLPFSYISEEDRYVVFTDVLHDILGINHPENHRALIRLEDVDPTYDTATLRRVADYLSSQGVPFSVAVIPVYNDPMGYYNNGVPQWIPMSKVADFINTLKYMISKGGSIVQHGYTHQYSNVKNPYTGVSGDDFEFYRVQMDQYGNLIYSAPLPEDSWKWARDRVENGIRELKQSGLSAVAFETPHYTASATDYQVFANTYPLTIQRVIYFDGVTDQSHEPKPKPGSSSNGQPQFFAGQFFPYVIFQDMYGQKVAPENLGNVDPYGWNGFGVRLPADIVRAAQKNRVVRDGFASAYFHPYLDISYLQQIVTGIKSLGYNYVPLSPGIQ